MPVVDDENELHDRDLSTKFNQHFHRSTADGIIDLSGNYWYLVQENELANFVSLFEGIIRVPMGRILSKRMLRSVCSRSKIFIYSNALFTNI